MNAFEFHCPTRIICGEHALHKLPVILVEMGVTKPLVVTDANLVALGITDHPSPDRSRLSLRFLRSGAA